MDYVLLVTPAIATEIGNILYELAEKRGVDAAAKRELITTFSRAMARAENVNVRKKTKKNYCSDAEDDKFIWCAIDGNADYIISGDNDLLKMPDNIKAKVVNRNGRPVSIITPEEFKTVLTQALGQKINQRRL